MRHVIVSCPRTGQTPLYSSMLQPWAEQHVAEKGIECYCLDAPDYIPTGKTHTVGSGQHRMGQALFNVRPGTWE